MVTDFGLADPTAGALATSSAHVSGIAGADGGSHSKAFFLGPEAGIDGQRFCIYHPPIGRTLAGWVVYVHPFAEEMNKSRHMAALQARALAHAGYGVLQIDLLGCGDSSGDFADATWHAWADDVVQACTWLARQGQTQTQTQTQAPLWLWGVRVGCLVAVEAAQRLSMPCNFLFWQPTPSGKLALHQFLRLKLAADLLAGQSKGAIDALRAQLAANTAIDVAGYRVAPALAAGLESTSLRPPVEGGIRPASPTGPAACRVEWFEVQARAEPTIGPASMPALQAWRDAGFAVRSHAVNGPAFWQSTEIESAPKLIDATTSALTDRSLA